MSASAEPSPGRRLLLDVLESPGLVESLPADQDLLSAGINSGELIRLSLAIEDYIGEALDDEVLPTLSTIEGIDRVLEEHAAAGRVLP
jgi:phosphopantetheine binding protein